MSHHDVGDWCFPAETITFLRDLSENNNREWFAANKARHETCWKKPAETFGMIMSDSLGAATGQKLSPKLFRIHRDVRFSKDKRPYNPHIHMSFVDPASAQDSPCYMVGIHADDIAVGVGTFAFSPEGLVRYRSRLSGKDGVVLAQIVAQLEAAGGRVPEPELKRAPSGLAIAAEHERLARYKGFSGWFDSPDAMDAIHPGFVGRCLDKFAKLQPLADWLADR